MKIVCEICWNLGQLQHLGRNYYRVKHYLGSVDGKLRFEYHEQSLEYVRNIPGISRETKTIDPIDQKNIDPNNQESKLFSRIMAGGVGFEPHTRWRNLPQLLFFLF